MIALDDGTYESGSEVEKDEDDEEPPPLMEEDDIEGEREPSMDCLVTLRALSAQ